jgi:hypothetical protein
MGITPCQYEVQKRRFALYQIEYLWKVQEPQAEGIVELVEEYEIELTRKELLFGELYRFLVICPVLLEGIWIALDTSKSLPHHVEFHIRREPLESVYLTRVHVALHELDDTDLEAVSHGPEYHAHRRGGLSFAAAGQNNNKAYLFLRFENLKFQLLHESHLTPDLIGAGVRGPGSRKVTLSDYSTGH